MPSLFCGEISLFGIRVLLESDRPEMARAALSGLLKWNNTPVPSSEQSVTVALVSGEANSPAAEDFRIRGKRLGIVRDGIELEADGELGRGTCRFRSGATTGEALDEAVKTAALFLVAQAGRTPVHASAVIVGDRAIVLAGRSGAGKSALAMAANRAGLPVLSEDTVFVQTEPSFCVWGIPGDIHLLEKDAPDGFEGGMRLRSGRIKRVVPIGLPQSRADDAVLCALVPGERVMLDRLDPEDAVQTITGAPEPGYEFYGSRMGDAVRAIATRGCWQLTLSKDPDAAIAALVGAFSNAGRISRVHGAHSG